MEDRTSAVPDGERSDDGGESPDAASAPDDSEDDDWEAKGVSSDSRDDEVVVQAARSQPASTSRDPVVWANDSVRDQVTDSIDQDVCRDKCLAGKEAQLQQFILSISHLTQDERKASIMTALAVLKEADTADRRRGHGLQDKFAYYLPMAGRICRETFCQCYGISTATVARYRSCVKAGTFAPKVHGGKPNHNATAIDQQWLIDWSTAFGAQVGEVVPVRVRRQKTDGSNVIRYFSPADYTLLPAHFTWDKLHTEIQNFMLEKNLAVRESALSTMRKLLKTQCPTIRIRSARSNVCDVCAIYHAQMSGGAVTTDLTEVFGKHRMAARRMRLEYKSDIKTVDSSHAVIIMDFSQNLTLPSVSSTLSQWYFLSLWSADMFGIHLANSGVQYNYLYEERTSGKGSNEVISLLHCFVKTVLAREGFTKLTIYADNCTGQNKNKFVVKFLLALTHVGDLGEVNLKFFVKGHTKNAVGRGFGHVRKKVAREDIWTMEKLVEVANAASTSSATVHDTPNMEVFKNYKQVPADAYTDIPGIRQYQIFSMKGTNPGVVFCWEGPDDSPTELNLRRRYDGILVDDTKVQTLLQFHLDTLSPPKPNAEKVELMHTKVRPYVPAEFADDVLYATPTADLAKEAKTAKQMRASRRKPSAVTAVPKKSTPPASSEIKAIVGDTEAKETTVAASKTKKHSPSAQAKQHGTTKKKAHKGV